jgi:hypothetical protein
MPKDSFAPNISRQRNHLPQQSKSRGRLNCINKSAKQDSKRYRTAPAFQIPPAWCIEWKDGLPSVKSGPQLITTPTYSAPPSPKKGLYQCSSLPNTPKQEVRQQAGVSVPSELRPASTFSSVGSFAASEDSKYVGLVRKDSNGTTAQDFRGRNSLTTISQYQTSLLNFPQHSYTGLERTDITSRHFGDS